MCGSVHTPAGEHAGDLALPRVGGLVPAEHWPDDVLGAGQIQIRAADRTVGSGCGELIRRHLLGRRQAPKNGAAIRAHRRM